VRSFPRTLGRRRLAAAALAAVTVAGLAVPILDPALPGASAAGGDKLRQKQKRVHQQVHQAGQALDESSAQLSAATKKLQAANKALTAAQARLAAARAGLVKAEHALAAAKLEDQRMQAALAAAQARLAQARTDLANGQQAVADQKRRVRDSFADMVQQGDPRLLAFGALMHAETPEDIARQQELNDTVLSSQSAEYQSLRTAEVLLTVRAEDVKKATDAVAVQRQQAADHLVVVQGLEQQATQARDAVAASVAQDAQARAAARSAHRAAGRARQHDVAVLRSLKAQEEKIKAQILRNARHEGNRSVGHTDGMFTSPVADTYVTSPYGWRKHPIYGYWGLHDGDDFHAPCGVPERAVDTGKVLSEYFSSVWGNRLYLSLGNINGHNYTVIYNHISKYRARVGQVVARGETVAYAGTTGWSTACHLHFTVLKDGNPIDPQTVL
jgi:murein DD-endopeptidase MepM/ murein hydrolase activator NlpD